MGSPDIKLQHRITAGITFDGVLHSTDIMDIKKAGMTMWKFQRNSSRESHDIKRDHQITVGSRLDVL